MSPGVNARSIGKKVCRPTKLAGFSILHLDKFAVDLRLRWLWLEWLDESKAWFGLGNLCYGEAQELFMSMEKSKILDFTLGRRHFPKGLSCQRYSKNQN
jgi:hypothetical protein